MGQERIEQRSADPASGPRPDTWRTVLTWNVPVVVALSCAAMGMPLLDLYGNNPTIFVAADLTSAQIVSFALVVVLVPALVAAATEATTFAVYRRALPWVHTGLVAILALMFALVMLRKAAPDLGLSTIAAAAAVGAGVAYAEQTWIVARTLLRYAAVLPVVVLFMFLVVSPTSKLFGEEADAVVLRGSEEYPPVLFLVFDELPLSSLTGGDGAIRDDLYPNFARFADSANWYRNAASQASSTELSMPSLLTGLRPDTTSVGSSVDWPRNLFTLLGNEYDVRAHEEATHLCPASVCQAGPGEGSSLAEFLDDASVVWGHLTLPSPWRDDLPAIDRTWGGFLEDSGSGGADVDDAPSSQAIDREAHEKLAAEGINIRPKPERRAAARAERLSVVADKIDGSVPQRLYFGHAVFPHWPWETTPEGRVVVDPPEIDLGRVESGPDEGRWVDDELITRFWLQRHLLQVGATDRLLGEFMDRLEEEGLWDDALVIVVADHGISFEPGRYHRGFEGTENFDEMYRVPLFIKLPGQTDGEVIDDPAQLLDVVPTMVDVLGIDVDWEFDGRSLLSAPPPPTRSVYHPDGSIVVSNDIDGLFRAVERKERRFADGQGWLSVAAAGELGVYVGRDVDELELETIPVPPHAVDEADALAEVDLDAAPVPVVITGTVELSDWQGGREFLLVLNGTVAGVAHLEGDGPQYRYAGVIAEELLVDGRNDVELVFPAP